VRRALPVSTGINARWAAKGDVHARKFLVLEKIPDDPRESYVGADRKFASPAVGLLALGWAMLPSHFPRWLGYFTAGVGTLGVIGMLGGSLIPMLLPSSPFC